MGQKLSLRTLLITNFNLTPDTMLRVSGDEQPIKAAELSRLPKIGVIDPAVHEFGENVSTLFTTAKRDGSVRLILNFKKQNTDVKYHYFKMDSLSTAIKLMSPILSYGFSGPKRCLLLCGHLPKLQKVPRVHLERKLISVHIFSKWACIMPKNVHETVKTGLCNTSKKGSISSGYTDDSYLQVETYEECVENVTDTVHLFDSLGFIVHPVK